MTFHFWGQGLWFALSIVVNVNCPAPTVSLNGQQCFSSQENYTDLFSTWLGAVSHTVSCKSNSCPSYLSFFLFLLWATSQFSKTVTKCWLLHLAGRLVLLTALLSWHSYDWLYGRAGRIGKHELWQNVKLWKRLSKSTMMAAPFSCNWK